MKIQPGTRELGPTNTELLLYTTCEGAAARLGHDLTIRVGAWHGLLTLGDRPAESALEVTADLASLEILESFGGAKEISDSDRREIDHNMATSLNVAEHPEMRFVATGITGNWREGEVTGDLTLHGHTRPVTFTVVEREGRFRLGGEIVQTEFGIKPYSAMMGTLRLADAVIVGVSIPAAE